MSNNIIDSIQLSGVTYTISGQSSGGGKAIEAGRGISVTTGETADTVSFNLPISAGTGENSIVGNNAQNTASGKNALALGGYYNSQFSYGLSVASGLGSVSFGGNASGEQSFAAASMGSTASGQRSATIAGYSNESKGIESLTSGRYVNAENAFECSIGYANVSHKANNTFGNSGNTLFSVGNGTAANARHNAFEIRQNGDIYLSSGGTDIKLQDHLGGGGSITIDPSLDSGSTNAVANSAITNAFTAVNDNISELSANSVTNCSNVDIVDAPATPPSTIENNYVKVTWEDDYTQTYAVDYNGNIGDGDTHYGSNITKVEFGSSGFEINTYNFGFGNDDCYGLKTAIFNGDVNLENITLSSAYQLEGVYFYAPSPSGITGVDEHFLSKVYDGCQTYEETVATYPIYVADLAAYSGAVLCYSYDLERNITWSEHFGNRLQEIPSGKKFVYNDFVTYSAATDAALSGKQDTLSAGTGISISGNVISATGGGGNPTVELTQAEYDALVTAGTVAEDTYYIITDAQGGDLSNYWTSAQTQSAINQATSGKASQSDLETVSGQVANKQDTLVSGTNIKTINNQSLLGSGNIDIQGGGGGGKAIEAGRGIAITTGETADTVSLDISAKKGSKDTALIFNYTYSNTATEAGATSFGYYCEATNQYTFANGNNTQARGYYSHSEGENTIANGWASHSDGQYTNANGKASHTEGSYVNANNDYESSQGRYNVSNKANTTFGDSGNTLFSVGNGTGDDARHNAFEIRQNGDIYLSSGGTDIKLQDHLGGGGASYSAGTGIDITNNVISVSGVVETSAITTTITSSSTDAQVPSAKAVYDIVGDIETLLSQI